MKREKTKLNDSKWKGWNKFYKTTNIGTGGRLQVKINLTKFLSALQMKKIPIKH